MTLSRRNILELTMASLPVIALTGDELLAKPADRLPKVWPNGSLSLGEFEYYYRLFSEIGHRAPTPRQDETLATAEEIYQLLHAWRPTAPLEEEFLSVSRSVLAHVQKLHKDFPVLRAHPDGQPVGKWPSTELARDIPRPIFVEVVRKGEPSRLEIVFLHAQKVTDYIEVKLTDGTILGVPVIVSEPAILRGQLFESNPKQPWPGRVMVECSDGIYRHGVAYSHIATVSEKPVVFRQAWRKLIFFYSDGNFEIRVPPGKTVVSLERGYEHEIVSKTLLLKPGEVKQLTLTSRRFIDMKSLGWVSGDTHVHWSVNSWDENEDLNLLRVVQRAEDVRVINNLTLYQWRAEKSFTKPDHAPMGPIQTMCNGEYHVQMGEEYRNDNQYGHINLLGLTKLITPISSGPGSGGDTAAIDYPLNKTIIEVARKQGAISCEAHNLGPFGTSSVPVNVIHGLSDCLDQLEPGHYYRFLDCGFKIGLGNGSDHPARVVGCCRVYVRTGPDWDFAKWIDGLKRGRSFTTSGPLLFLSINDTEIGETVILKSGDILRVQAKAISRRPLGTFEIVSNGEVLKSVTTNEREAKFEFEMKVNEPRWFVARASWSGNYDALSGPDIAHTSGVYADIDGKTVFRKAAAEWWIDNIKKHRERVRLLANFANDTQRQESLAYIDAGMRLYQERIAQRGASS